MVLRVLLRYDKYGGLCGYRIRTEVFNFIEVRGKGRY